jgi:tetratricopeptide (TPR) repeat protein
VSDLVRRIGSAALPELAVENRTVVDAFGLSFGQLAAPAQRVFRLLGSYPGRLFDAPAVAALGDLSLTEAEDLLGDLVDVHLVEEPEPDVFRLHDLLREYATALAAELTEQERRAAVVRSLDLEMHAAVAAEPSRLAVTLRDLRSPVALRPDLVAALSDSRSGMARMERTRPSLGAFLDAARVVGRLDLVWMLARAAWRYLWWRCYADDISALFTVAREAARCAGDLGAEAMCYNYLASAHFVRDRPDLAEPLVMESLRLRRATGDVVGMSIAMGNLSGIYNLQGRYTEAAAVIEESLRLGTRDAVGASPRLDGLSLTYSYLGRHAEAIHLQRRRLLLALDDRSVTEACQALLHLIKVRIRAGDIASELAERGLRVVQRAMVRRGMTSGECDTRAMLGDVLRTQGRYEEAIVEITLGLERMREFGNTREECASVNTLAQTIHESGDAAAAVDTYRHALDRACTAPHRYEQARAHLGLGDCLAGSDPVAAREHWQEAHRVFTEIGVPERAEAERRLAGLVAVSRS